MANTDGNSIIRYEFDRRPPAGDTMQVAPGIHWLRMPLPFALGHINLWLLEDGDKWTIVDTGVNVEESEKVWAKTFLETMGGKPVDRVIVTHLHPDHVGCAGMLCDKTNAELWMTREEYLMCRVLVADTGRTAPPEGKDFYSAAGFPEDALHNYEKMFGFFGKFVSEIPQSYRRINAGNEYAIGKNRWKIIIGRGHSPEHACLYCEEQNLLISGDQLLPTISSNVSVYPTEPHANPLHDWLTSLADLKNAIDENVLVFPAHGKPFRGAHGRLDALIAEHEGGLAALYDLCAEPKRALDTFTVLFKREIKDSNLIMATGEAIAHLNYLLELGRLSVEADADGVNWYRQV
jgi:glyoxylase-like metal-dependent hydrolase (beta-lactamase superfamily II)